MDFAEARERMVRRQIEGRGVSDARVLAAMRRVPREAFVPPPLQQRAYDDTPLPIAEGQTISQPFIVAAMIAAAEIGPGDRVLEIGTGSGYAAAVMAEIAKLVFTIERHAALAADASARLTALGYRNVEVRRGDGSLGWPEAAPFDAILVAASAPAPPPSLRRQLAIGGRLIAPVGGRPQRLLKLVRRGEDGYAETDLGEVMFVPLIGVEGWAGD